MKLKNRYEFDAAAHRTYTVQEAVERQLNANEYGSGELETMKREVENCKTYLGRLTALLAGNGLSQESIEILLPSYEIIKGD